MARKTLEVTISAEGRDQGKTYLLTEMPASQGEKWAARAFLAMTKSGIQVDESVMSMGMAGIAMFGLKAIAGLPWDLAEPLLDEMFGFIKIKMPAMARDLVEDDIEEVATRVKLRYELFEMHTGFSKVVAQWKQTRQAPAKVEDSPSTSTSPEASAQ